MSSSTTSYVSSSKFKFLIIFVFISVLGFTVYKMMQFEESIREKL